MVTLTDLKEALREILGFGAEEIGREGVADALAKTLDIHSAFTWEKFLREGVDFHFNARCVDAVDAELLARASDYWTQDEYIYPYAGYVTCPSNLHAVAIYSKRAFRYPSLSVRAILPNLTTYVSPFARVYIGVENGAAGGNGLASFRLRRPAEFIAYLSNFVTTRLVDISSLLPADYDTVRHNYTIELTKSMAVFYVDGVVAAYGLITPNSFFAAIAPPPYGLFSIETPISPAQTAFMEVVGFGEGITQLGVAPYDFRVSDGDPLPPRVIRLYDAGTTDLFAGLTIAVGSETSHPFPIFGYDSTVHFQATTAGTLTIQVLTQTNNWRTYASPAVAANTLLSSIIGGQGVLARVTFTPTAFPSTISEAEVVLD